MKEGLSSADFLLVNGIDTAKFDSPPPGDHEVFDPGERGPERQGHARVESYRVRIRLLRRHCPSTCMIISLPDCHDLGLPGGLQRGLPRTSSSLPRGTI